MGAAALLAIGLAAWAIQEKQEAQVQRGRAEEESVAARKARTEAEAAAIDARQAQGRTWLANARTLLEAKNSFGARLKAIRALGFSGAGRENLTATQQDAYPVLLQEGRSGWQEARTLISANSGLDLLWQNGALPQHVGMINSADASPDGRYLASTSENESVVRIWDAATGSLITTLPVSVSDNEVVGFSPDSRFLAVAGDAEIEFWEIAEGAFSPAGAGVIRAPQAEQGISMADDGEEIAVDASPPDFRSMAFSPDGQVLALGDDKGRLYIWRNWKSFEGLPGVPGKYQPHQDRIMDLEFQPGSGALLASVARQDPTVKLVDGSTFDFVRELSVEPFTRDDDEATQFRSVSFRSTRTAPTWPRAGLVFRWPSGRSRAVRW